MRGTRAHRVNFPAQFTRSGRAITAEMVHPPRVTSHGLRADVVTAKFHSALSGMVRESARQHIVDVVMELHHIPATAELNAALTTGVFI
jgi:hypothetical protein